MFIARCRHLNENYFLDIIITVPFATLIVIITQFPTEGGSRQLPFAKTIENLGGVRPQTGRVVGRAGKKELDLPARAGGEEKGTGTYGLIDLIKPSGEIGQCTKLLGAKTLTGMCIVCDLRKTFIVTRLLC